MLGDTLARTGRPYPLRTAYVDAVATDSAFQGRGIGSAVMRRLADEAERECELNALSSTQAAGFYERLGWERWRGPTAARTPQGWAFTPEDTVLILQTASTRPSKPPGC